MLVPPSTSAPLDRASTARRPLTPTDLWYAVLDARALWAHERHLPQKWRQSQARHELLQALEAYVRSLDERGRPVPYALRDELRLVQLTSAAGHPPGLIRRA